MKFLILLLITTITFAHPHHHSLAIFDYNEKTQQLELSLKLLTEDYKQLENIEKYINQHLKVSQNEKILQAVFHGQEIDVENTWLYFTLELKPVVIKSITIINTILIFLNPNQFNTIKLNIGNFHQAHNFSAQTTKHIFQLKNNLKGALHDQ